MDTDNKKTKKPLPRVELVLLLKTNVTEFNAYREAFPEHTLDFDGEDLHGLNLSGANLRGVGLQDANLRDVILNGVTFDAGTDLQSTILDYADCTGATGLEEAATGGMHTYGTQGLSDAMRLKLLEMLFASWK